MAAGEEVVLAADGDRADGVLSEVVVDLELSVIEVAGDVLETADEVLACLAHGRLWQEVLEIVAQPCAELVEE